MYINFNIINFHFYFFKVNALEPESVYIILFTERDGLVTGDMSNEICSEGCNEMKKMPSCQRGMSKLSESQYKSKGLMQVNSCYKTGPTLPQHDSKKLKECIFSFSDPGFRRKDFGLSIHTCTMKNLIFLYEFIHLTLDYIIIKYGNLGEYCSLNLIFIYSYLNIFYTLNILSNLRCIFINKLYSILSLNRGFSRRRLNCQEILCQNGGKKFEKANGLGNSRHIFINKPNCNKFGGKLNSIYLNLNRRESYRGYSTKDSVDADRLNSTIREWPDNKTLLKIKFEVIQEQIALADLAECNDLYNKVVKKRQTILLKSLKFRIIAVYKISKSKGAKTPGIDNISFAGDSFMNKKKY